MKTKTPIHGAAADNDVWVEREQRAMSATAVCYTPSMKQRTTTEEMPYRPVGNLMSSIRPSEEAMEDGQKVTAAYTPGPWTVSPQRTGFPPNDASVMSGDICVAHRVNRANARLIAAAPEMLAALEHIARVDLRGPATDNEHIANLARGLQQAARAAIRKARGEA